MAAAPIFAVLLAGLDDPRPSSTIVQVCCAMFVFSFLSGRSN
jgi:hypothetical protein